MRWVIMNIDFDAQLFYSITYTQELSILVFCDRTDRLDVSATQRMVMNGDEWTSKHLTPLSTLHTRTSRSFCSPILPL